MTFVGPLARGERGAVEWAGGMDPIVRAAAWGGSPASAVPAPAGRAGRGGRDWRAAAAAGAPVVPLVLVNGFATFGQGLWAHANLVTAAPGWVRVVVAALFAAALESISLYLAAEAHTALMAGDAAFGRRVASYGAAALVGVLNWLHWSGPGGSPTVAAVVFAGFSAISPWLWALRSRTLRRDQLRDLGLVDSRLPRFSMARWLLYPVRTWRVWRSAAWDGITDPALAIETYATQAAARLDDPAARGVVVDVPDRQSVGAPPGPAGAVPSSRPAVEGTATDRPAPAERRGAADPDLDTDPGQSPSARASSGARPSPVGRTRTGRTPVDEDTLRELLQPMARQGMGRDSSYRELTVAGHAVSKARVSRVLEAIRADAGL